MCTDCPRASLAATAFRSNRGRQFKSRRARELTYTRSRRSGKRQPRWVHTAAASGTRRANTDAASVRSCVRSSRVNGVVADTR
ncbi:Uncharacterised protein [Mycobacterium tuberculosis]|uniref:Uncharacterized protein n=1 Tax=Mycobacterium tuberculosis TaxID=1773 RepID=A0A916LHX9_MYCTX|nr:Uncharacterised protein [Mycobacterium tuberculosis]